MGLKLTEAKAPDFVKQAWIVPVWAAHGLARNTIVQTRLSDAIIDLLMRLMQSRVLILLLFGNGPTLFLTIRHSLGSISQASSEEAPGLFLRAASSLENVIAAAWKAAVLFVASLIELIEK